MSSRVNLADNEVTIVLFDQGVGIPNTLDPTAYESIRAALANISKLKLSTQPSDGEMILAATEYHRSGTGGKGRGRGFRSEEHTSELQSLMRISYAVFCWKKKKKIHTSYNTPNTHHY